MRKEAMENNERANIPYLSYYHGSHFETLGFFNSDRFVRVTPDYRVSSDNTKSTLSIIKEGSEVGGYGLELEVCCNTIKAEGRKTVLANIMSMIFKQLFPNDLFRMEEDCTVHAECVTQVMSKSFIRNNYKNFKTMWNEYFPSFGITTENGQCGMHVNISLSLFGKDREEQIKNVRKLGYTINSNYNFFKVAFNRTGETTWCPKMNSTLEYWRDTDIYDFPTSHSECCINMAHVSQGRVEIRLVGGQKNFACFRNTMETIFFLVDRVKKLNWKDCNNLEKVFTGCNSYVFDRIKDNCFRNDVVSIETIEKIRPTVKEVIYL